MTNAQRRFIRRYAAEHGLTFEDACRKLGVDAHKDGAMMRWFEALGREGRKRLVCDAFAAARANDAWSQALALGREGKALEVHTKVFTDDTERSLVVHVKMPKDGNEAAVRSLLERIEADQSDFRSSVSFEGDFALPAMFADRAYEEEGRYYMLGVRELGRDALLLRIERFETKPDLVP